MVDISHTKVKLADYWAKFIKEGHSGIFLFALLHGRHQDFSGIHSQEILFTSTHKRDEDTVPRSIIESVWQSFQTGTSEKGTKV